MLGSLSAVVRSRAGGFLVGASVAGGLCVQHYWRNTEAGSGGSAGLQAAEPGGGLEGEAAGPVTEAGPRVAAPVPAAAHTPPEAPPAILPEGDSLDPAAPASAPRPPQDNDPAHPGMTVFVRDSFVELVIDADMDVLVETMLPGCRSCGALTPRLKMAAFLLKDVPGLRIGVMDIEVNDPPLEYLVSDATPQLRLFPRGKKDSAQNVPMLGDLGKEGLPTVLEIVEFLAENCTTSITITPELREAAEAMEKEAEYLYACRLQLAAQVNMWRDFSALGAAACGGDEKAFEAASEDVRTALFKAFSVLDSPGASSAEAARAALVESEAALRRNKMTAAWLKGSWITSLEQYMEEAPALMASGSPVAIAFGNGSLETWTSETGAFLREAGDTVSLAHVDCSYLKDLCERCDASAGAPAIHFYRGGMFVGKVFWENKDLVGAMLKALEATPAPAPPLPYVAEMEARRKAASEEAGEGTGEGEAAE